MKSVERWQTNTHTNKHTYWVKTEETFFNRQVFIFYFYFFNSLNVKKAVSNWPSGRPMIHEEVQFNIELAKKQLVQPSKSPCMVNTGGCPIVLQHYDLETYDWVCCIALCIQQALLVTINRSLLQVFFGTGGSLDLVRTLALAVEGIYLPWSKH